MIQKMKIMAKNMSFEKKIAENIGKTYATVGLRIII